MFSRLCHDQNAVHQLNSRWQHAIFNGLHTHGITSHTIPSLQAGPLLYQAMTLGGSQQPGPGPSRDISTMRVLGVEPALTRDFYHSIVRLLCFTEPHRRTAKRLCRRTCSVTGAPSVPRNTRSL